MGVLNPMGAADPYAAIRTEADRLSNGGALIRAVSTLAAMAVFLKSWNAALEGHKPSALTTLATLGVALGSLIVGLNHDHSTLAQFGNAAFWQVYAVLLMAGLAMAHVARPNSTGRNAWALMVLISLWLPSQVGGFLALGIQVGAH